MAKSAGTQIKVRAGQVYYSSFSERNITMSEHDENKFINGAPCFYKFSPQSDLEWLAVNCDECPEQVGGNFFLHKEYNQVAVINRHGYTRQQWQNMRYYLGLDKKPHCKLIDGEWVKQ